MLVNYLQTWKLIPETPKESYHGKTYLVSKIRWTTRWLLIITSLVLVWINFQTISINFVNICPDCSNWSESILIFTILERKVSNLFHYPCYLISKYRFWFQISPSHQKKVSVTTLQMYYKWKKNIFLEILQNFQHLFLHGYNKRDFLVTMVFISPSGWMLWEALEAIWEQWFSEGVFNNFNICISCVLGSSFVKIKANIKLKS